MSIFITFQSGRTETDERNKHSGDIFSGSDLQFPDLNFLSYHVVHLQKTTHSPASTLEVINSGEKILQIKLRKSIMNLLFTCLSGLP